MMEVTKNRKMGIAAFLRLFLVLNRNECQFYFCKKTVAIFRIMHKLLTLFLTFCFLESSTAQALIKDPDGYCNIRQSASSQSIIIDTLLNDRIVFVFEEQAEGNWLPVDYIKGKETLSGYVHKSRIVLLTSLAKFKQTSLNDTMLKLQYDSTKVTMTITAFHRHGRKIQYDKPQGEQTFVKSIDNTIPWGTDGNIPKMEYKAIQFKTGNSRLNFPAETFKDLFEPNLDMTTAYLDKVTGKVYIEAINSDGAGGYLVIWTIKDKQITGRETFIPF